MVFGREYADRTMKDILALSVSRLNIVMAKFIVVFIWSLLLLILLYGLSIITGLGIKKTPLSQDFSPVSLKKVAKIFGS